MKSRPPFHISGIALFLCLICLKLQAQNTSLPVGAIPGSADVTAMGAATYSIPIEVVPGTRGVQPNLSVVYNSMAGTGILGGQWDLDGISAITRVGQNTFLDLRSTAVTMTYSDRFALDGNRLICSDPTLYGRPGTLYQPEFEDFSKIYSYGAVGFGPEYFKVYRDDGSVAEYGNSADSKQRLANGIYSWYVNKITDLNGNYMTFTYGYSGSEVWIDHIDYTGNTTANLSPYARVSFEYNTYAHIGSNFLAGYEMPQTRLLRAITVQYKNGNDYELVRQYQFDYTDEFPKRLDKVTLMGSDSTRLNPTSVEWNNLTLGIPDTTSLTVFPNLVVDENTYHTVLDFNGDGLSDIVEYNYNKQRLLINQGSSFQESYSHTSQGWYVAYLLPADIDGDGISEVITIYKSTNPNDYRTCVTQMDSSQHIHTLFDDLETTSIDNVFSGDFCGNGKHQLLIFYNQTKVFLWGQSIRLDTILANNNGRFDLLDFDGDGQTEFIRIEGVIPTCSLTVYKYKPQENFIECLKPSFYFSGYPLQFGDINGDGISDCLYRNNSYQYSFALGSGKGFFENISLSCSIIHDTLVPMLADINNDGYDDILTFHRVNSTNNTERAKVLVYLSKGYYNNNVQLYYNGMTSPSLLPKASQFGNLTVSNLFIGNFNNDKRLDFLVAKHYRANNYLTLYQFNEGKMHAKVKEIRSGDGSYVQWKHQDIYGYYYRYASYINTLPYFFDVVKTIRTSGDRPTRKFACHYQFEKPQYSFRRHAIMGFSIITRKDSVLNVIDTTTFANLKSNAVWQDVLMPIRRTCKVGNTVIKSEIYTPVIQYLAFNRRKPYISCNVSNDMLSNTIVIRRSVLDYNGRLTGSSTTVRDINGTGFVTKDSVQYYSSTINLSDNAFVTQMDSTISCSYSDNSSLFFTKKQIFSYSSDGKLLSSSTLCDGITNAVTNTVFDAFGNVKKQAISATGCENRAIAKLFDPTGRFCITEFNALGHATSIERDPRTGRVLNSTDENILTTSYSYDAFGKLTAVHHPDGNTDTVKYKWYDDNEIPYAKYYTVTSVTGRTFDTEQYYDLLGRNICTRDNGFYTDTRYNSKGLVEKVSKPYMRGTDDEDKLWDTYSYDEFGRVTSELGSYKNLTYSYNGRSTTVTDHLRHVSSTKVIDAAGRPALANDQGGQIQYDYSPVTLNGKPVLNTSVTTNGNTTTIVTDQRGNRIRLQDPDAGVTLYDYNAYGEMVKQVIAKGDTTKMSYDKLGRLLQKQYIDSSGVIKNMQYFYDRYDNHNKGLGKPSKVTINGETAEIFRYDTLSRLSQHTRYVDGIAYTESYAYNTYGQLATLTYPDGFAVDYTYTGKGYLEEIKRHDNHYNVFKAYTYNIYGQPTQCGYGNATATKYEYNAAGLLTRMFTGLKDYSMVPYPFEPMIPLSFPADLNEPTGLNGLPDLSEPIEQPFTVDSTIQNFRYTYDNMGRLTQRTQMNSQYEAFQYDNMDRLTSFTQGTVNGVSQAFATSYDPQGNILSNTLAGTYSYDSDKPHAVTTVDPSDGFPNAIAADSCETEYNSFNQPSRIAEGDVEMLLEYGADNQRVKAVFKRNGQVERTRYYINANYEKEVDANGVITHYNYVYGVNGLAAICVRRNGVDSMYYVHPDRLGSYTHITNADRQVVRSLHFDPWGNVKADTNWTVFAEREPGELAGVFRFDRGFTGHEHYADLGIINMNGRLYDPVIARFFSPDNFVQAPDFTQSYNRYSYCLNNPLQYTDPSGEFWHLIVGAAIGGFLNVALNANNIDNCWQGLAYFGIGAVAGALSAGVGAGISTAFAGGSFSAGFIGTTAGVSATGFLSGAASGAASGFIGSFITSSGNSWISGNSFSKELIDGITQGGIGLFIGSLTGGIIGGIDALYKGTNFWTGTTSFDLSDNYGATGKPIGEKTVTGKYVGKFEGVNLYEANIPEGSAATLPGKGIILSKGQYSMNSRSLYTQQLLQHEFGHILQARKIGLVAYYSVIAKESFISACFDGINGWSHDLFWTETWANYLAQNYFGANSLINSWPSQNISWFNYLRLLSANIIP